ncbi:NUDIX hydrolase [Beutenbergia cavernae DSM 12333]|uniref:NUDIX hydrolase n=1 Tax=Beutenbergia cavernae (strain ATCC BAA-8 / DSM 12333 / CCUG 43141 / JCM 11478 / NBRC 16432 / NCIMB 13614 / HKI 0122) TaxID=471853 RepID=C5C5Q1_BEUC1|nr:NUDIX domain-containing protein [Beutenbergia cavernae]ACQ80242.1 NUDIX hydrolase [Beutenbergia cavernae DSM 12333]
MTPASSVGHPTDGEGWVRGADGVPFRRAARVLLLDPQDRVLLVRGHDADQPERTWWFTVGGGIDRGETARDAAVREVFEETGLRLDPERLEGPVLTRSALFDFFARTVRQDEEFFLARLDGLDRDAPLVTDNWTDVERAFMDEVRWWPLPALAQVTEEVFPAELVEVTQALLPGWNGVTRHLGLARDEAATGDSSTPASGGSGR